LHGNGYLAKNPTRRQLLNADHDEQIRREEQQHEEHLELMNEFGQLQQQMSAWEAERLNYARQIDEIMKAREADKERLGKRSKQCYKQDKHRQRYSRY
jgi:chaperonin cofactor prefoldin